MTQQAEPGFNLHLQLPISSQSIVLLSSRLHFLAIDIYFSGYLDPRQQLSCTVDVSMVGQPVG